MDRLKQRKNQNKNNQQFKEKIQDSKKSIFDAEQVFKTMERREALLADLKHKNEALKSEIDKIKTASKQAKKTKKAQIAAKQKSIDRLKVLLSDKSEQKTVLNQQIGRTKIRRQQVSLIARFAKSAVNWHGPGQKRAGRSPIACN